MGRHKINELNKTYGRLTVLAFNRSTNKGVNWLCRCTCGNFVIVLGSNLRNGGSNSCGCLHLELLKQVTTELHKFKDRRSNHPLFKTWKNMIERCYNDRNVNYKNYGGRGIIVCNLWLNNFWKFVDDIGKKPQGDYSIERKNNNGNYEPLNCKWGTRKEQASNKRKRM